MYKDDITDKNNELHDLNQIMKKQTKYEKKLEGGLW